METETKTEGFFKTIFTKKKMTHLFISNMIGNFIGFAVGFMTSTLFSHYSYERRGLSNLFGALPRKKVLVDDTPTWIHWLLSIILGFIAMEAFHYFYDDKKYLEVWAKLKKRIGKGQ